MDKLELPKGHPHEAGRVCTTCGDFKPASEYSLERDSRSFGGISMRSKCRPCNELRKYKGFIKKTYGISYEDYTKMQELQGNCCAICGSLESLNKRTDRFFVDHCHTTGKVRGLLCSKCNHGLGLFNDNPKLLLNAINYLGKDF
jgi:hypothetical protein